MSLTDRVLAHLRETRGTWTIDLTGMICSLRLGWCPLYCAGVVDFYPVYGRIDELPDEGKAIMVSADWAAEDIGNSEWGQYFNPGLRARMLEAAGLVEGES